MPNDIEEQDSLALLAEEFVERYRLGENPDIREYAEKYSGLADRIHRLFPTLILMEELSPSQDCGPLPEPGNEQLPQRFGDFEILREIGRGGMGVVYHSRQISLGRDVALKVLTQSLTMRTNATERFLFEARSAGHLHHPHIVPVFDVGTVGRTHYYSMQLIHGCGLDQILTELRRVPLSNRSQNGTTDTINHLDPRDALSVTSECLAAALLSGTAVASGDPSSGNGMAVAERVLPKAKVHEIRPQYYRRIAELACQLSDALAFAHKEGILHRDIKPSNLLLDVSGNIWVTDFGLAKAMEAGIENELALTGTGDVVGTIRYMAPERFSGWSDRRSDVYGVGMTLYEMITLQPAFDTIDRLELMGKVRNTIPVPPRSIDRRIPRDLETIVLKCIEKEPAARYGSAVELAADLRNFLASRPIAARRVDMFERARQWCRRNLVVTTLSILLISVLTIAWLTTFYFWRSSVASDANARQHLAAERRNLDLAISAVDQFCTRVSRDQRLLEHDLRPLRQDLLATAVDFHKQLLDLRDRTSIARIDMARAYRGHAELTEQIDAPERAIELYQQAIDEFEGLLKTTSGDADVRVELAVSFGSQARLLSDTGQSEHAIQTVQKGIDLLNPVVTTHSNRKEAAVQMAKLLSLKGYILVGIKKFDEAQAAYRESILSWNRVRSLSPDDAALASETARTHYLSGIAYLLRGLKWWHEADSEFTAGWEILQPFVNDADRDDFDKRTYLSILRSRGRVAKISGNPQLARAFLTETIRLQTELTVKNPAALSYQHELATAWFEMGSAEAVDGHQRESEEAFRMANRIWDQLVQTAPGNVLWKSWLGNSFTELGDISASENEVEALKNYNLAVEIQESILKREPSSGNAAIFLPPALANRASLLARQKKFELALHDWDRAIEIGHSDMIKFYMINRAWAAVNLGDHEAASSALQYANDAVANESGKDSMVSTYELLARIHAVAVLKANGDMNLSESQRQAAAEKYSVTAVEMIAKSLEAGTPDPATFENIEEFDGIRHRPDFKALFQN